MGYIFSMLNIESTPMLLIVCMIICSLVEISPLKINPLSCLYHFFTANQKILAELNSLSEKMKNLEADMARDKAIEARIRILQFGDEILHRKTQTHTKERFEQVMEDIDFYEKYCNNHPDFKNNITIMNTSVIKNKYMDCLSGKGQFLPYEVQDEGSK